MHPSLSLAQQYQLLQESAQAFGFHEDATRIARRMADLEQPFLLFVMGSRGAGKSTVIDTLAGNQVTTPISTATWPNVYRHAGEGRPHAEIHRRQADGPPEIVPIAQAQTLSRTGLPFRTSPAEEIARIDWYVEAPGLPEGVALVEVPCDERGEVSPAYCWQADALLWVMRADQLHEAEPAQALIQVQKEKRSAAVPSMGVVTYMDAVPSEHWGTILQYVRTQAAPHLDHVVPFALQRTPFGRLAEHTTAPLRREVRNRFFHGAEAARSKSHARFLDTMRHRITTGFEAFVDRVLENRAHYLQVRRHLEGQLGRRADELKQRIDGLVRILAAHARARAAHLETGADAPSPDALPRLDAFFQGIRRDLVHEAGLALARVRFDGEPLPEHDGTARPGAPALPLKLPAPPVRLLAVLRGDAGPEEGARVAARLYRPDEDRLEGEAAASPAALWQTAADWIEEAVRQALGSLGRWVQDACDRTRKQLLARIRAGFKSLHGFLPEETQAALLRLETYYLRLRGRAVPVPTPHLSKSGLSPALFLLKLQEPGFAEHWNRALIRTTSRRVLPALQRRLREELEQRRDALLTEWAEARPALDESLQTIWMGQGRQLALAPSASWSVSWATSLMRGVLRAPARYLSQSRFAAALPHGTGLSLFLGPRGDQFLRSRGGNGAPSPEQVAATKLQDALTARAERLWRDDASIQISLSLRRRVGYRIASAALLMAALGAAWAFLYGTGTVSLALLAVLSVGYGGAARHLIERFIRKEVEASRAFQAEQIHQTVRTLLNERVDQLQRYLAGCVHDDDFLAEIEAALLQQQAAPGPGYLAYGDLVGRLFTLQAA